MRAAPVGLVHLGDPYRIYRDSLLQSVVTHRDSMAIAAAACQAYAVARAAASLPGSLASLESRMALCADLAMLLEGLERPGYRLRGGSGATSLHGRIGTELPCYLQDDRAPFDNWYNGAYVLESLFCALWCFLHSPEDFEANPVHRCGCGPRRRHRRRYGLLRCRSVPWLFPAAQAAYR